jgi:hypothetical protein
MRTEPCKQCGASDFYQKGEFSYCRPCHTEAQKRYLKNKAQGIQTEVIKPPNRSLSLMLSSRSNTTQGNKTHCINGHPLSGDNVRLSSQRNGKHTFRRCRTCERNAKRVKYGLAPEAAPATLGSMLDNLDS